MTDKEKAKAYDEAIRKAAILYKASEPMSACNVIIETIFPELTESEDEKIRRELIDYINRLTTSPNYIDKYNTWIDWLEKQGEQKYIPKYKIGDYVKNTNYKGEPIYEIVYMDKECYICEYRGKERIGDKAVMHFSFDNPYLRLVQKPANKVEPKFHEGDWVILKARELSITLQIVNVDINKKLYWFNDSSYLPIVDEECLRHWTIQDAKDGNVLVDEDNNIGIFEGIEGMCWHSYIYLGCNNCLYGFSIGGSHMQNNTKPATKEQRDTLEKAMADANYIFDFEKKELKEIEQKPAWSEEDERMYRRLHNLIYSTSYCDSRKELSDWLKSIKQRIGG